MQGDICEQGSCKSSSSDGVVAPNDGIGPCIEPNGPGVSEPCSTAASFGNLGGEALRERMRFAADRLLARAVWWRVR